MKQRTQRGSALLTVILVLLILSSIGVAAVYLMNQQNRLSGSVQASKLSLYAAETGLRRGESVLKTAGVGSVSPLLSISSSGAPETPAIFPTRPVQPVDGNTGTGGTYNITHLGTYLTDNGLYLADVPVNSSGPGKVPALSVFYSLCIRDNPEDIDASVGLASAQLDTDGRVRLISIGWVQGGNGKVVARRILEEEYNFSGLSQAPSAQKGTNQGATSTVQY
ncbi:MAG: hypothetical protein GXP48_10685 [Acidobacteria bacterium]|nr:hypothetical protein [Acidobacteriota bacterium]